MQEAVESGEIPVDKNEILVAEPIDFIIKGTMGKIIFRDIHGRAQEHLMETKMSSAYEIRFIEEKMEKGEPFVLVKSEILPGFVVDGRPAYTKEQKYRIERRNRENPPMEKMASTFRNMDGTYITETAYFKPGEGQPFDIDKKKYGSWEEATVGPRMFSEFGLDFPEKDTKINEFEGNLSADEMFNKLRIGTSGLFTIQKRGKVGNLAYEVAKAYPGFAGPETYTFLVIENKPGKPLRLRKDLSKVFFDKQSIDEYIQKLKSRK